ncbi:MAG: polysaccharide deacetylase family protein [Christensenellales bacterium]
MKKIKILGVRMTSIITNVIILAMLALVAITSFGGYSSIFASSSNVDAPYYKGESGRNEVSLMINVYWGTEYIEPMLEVLKQYGAKCTFFVGGSWVDDNNELLLKIIDEGHEIGNHGYFHKDHKKLSYEGNLSEIKATNTLVEAVSGYKIKLFAPPSGSYGNDALKAAKSLDMPVIMWSKDTIDWRDKDSSLVLERATKNVSAGDLILAHPTKHTLEALPQILQKYEEKGLKAVTVSQIIQKNSV